ncbi:MULTISPECIES: hypothetical protein [Clostridium]|uniref:Uncharacterized protein n=1 Tax=Clostridium frigoriphilum TaxID=443253 RepID=A0ABU7UHI8_9CLOT|nr:hypothetical protein [Clostridium sp. DSM 17811]MBU3098348.1 hypothetical protein [Clostridium sp. DSM 17811]
MDNEMLKVYQRDITILKMQKKGLLKQLAKVEKGIIETQEYCRQILGGINVDMLVRSRASKELSKAMFISKKEANKIMNNMVREVKSTKKI